MKARATGDKRDRKRSRSTTKNRVERFLRLTEAWQEAAAQIEYQDAVCTAARQDGVTVTNKELQDAVDALREERGLTEVSDTLTWLAAAGLDMEDIENEAELRVLEDKLCDRLDEREVEDEFQSQRIRFDSVRLRVIVAEDEATARMLVRQLQDARDTFFGADALEHCTGRRMEWGWFFREELPEQAAAPIFRALPGSVVGPIQVGEGTYALYHVEAFGPAILKTDIERQLRKEMVTERTRRILNPDDPHRFILK
jgi:hypothetical protein